MVASTMNELIQTPANPRKRVIVADDHPDMAALLARALSQAEPDVDILSAQNGREALEKLGQLPVDLLITDLMMPEMNGVELIEHLGSRESGAPTFVILITAYDITGFEEELKHLKIDKIILKPFPPELLVQDARRALNESGQTSPGFASPTIS